MNASTATDFIDTQILPVVKASAKKLVCFTNNPGEKNSSPPKIMMEGINVKNTPDLSRLLQKRGYTTKYTTNTETHSAYLLVMKKDV